MTEISSSDETEDTCDMELMLNRLKSKREVFVSEMKEKKSKLDTEIEEQTTRVAQKIREKHPYVYTIQLDARAKGDYCNFNKSLGCFSTRQIAETNIRPCSLSHHDVTIKVVVKEERDMTDNQMINMNSSIPGQEWPDYYD